MEQVANNPRSGTTRLVSSQKDVRRQELANFVRSRRASLDPETIGMPRTVRRRVRGLRREEVAEAAGISVAWYTWIEQARELNLSLATLNGVAKALRLNEDEQTHLFQLAGQSAPTLYRCVDEEAQNSLQRFLGALDPNPAYALDRNWQIVAWNKSAELIFGDLSQAEPEDRNYLKLAFTSERFRNLFVNWEDAARCSIANFRGDSAGEIEGVTWQLLVAELKRKSRFFRELWRQHDVAWPHSWKKELRLKNGTQVFNTFDLSLTRPMQLRIVTFIPATATDIHSEYS